MPAPGAREIRVSKAVPSFVDDEVAGDDGELSKDSFGHLATFEYRTVLDSRIRMGDTMDVSTDEYFKKEGLIFFGRFVVLLPFGIVIPSQPQHSGVVFLPGQMAGNTCGRWEIGFVRQGVLRSRVLKKRPITLSQLFVNASAKTPVAVFHRRQFGIIGEARPPSLEIFEAGKELVDLIVVTGA